MSQITEAPFKHIQFFATSPYPCSYLDDREARSQVATPMQFITPSVYAQLVRNGFRRSGVFVYRPYCDRCQACQSIRVLTHEFKPNRSQMRAWKKHQNLRIDFHPLEFSDEHYQLYLRYQEARHPGGGMDADSHEQYAQFLLQSQVDSKLIEFRDTNGELRMVSLIDFLPDGISSVYTFYDPAQPKVSYGVFNILWQIEYARALDLPFVYLGFYIAESRKMSYKNQFQPFQLLQQGEWQDFKHLQP